MNRVDLEHLAARMNERLLVEHDADMRRTGAIRPVEEDDIASFSTRNIRPAVFEMVTLPIAAHIRSSADLAGLVGRVMDESGAVKPAIERGL